MRIWICVDIDLEQKDYLVCNSTKKCSVHKQNLLLDFKVAFYSSQHKTVANK